MKSPNEDQGSISVPKENVEYPSPPRLVSYLILVAGAWTYLALQAWLLTMLLGSSRGIYLFSIILAVGFLLAALFDFGWLKWGRRD
ncbi:hypothetical protein HY256_09770 [Candidatus Sumerlaeota bacterium]|nr:hypothetical protein [Candidatus Sumerlaeota bacterium]